MTTPLDRTNSISLPPTLPPRFVFPDPRWDEMWSSYTQTLIFFFPPFFSCFIHFFDALSYLISIRYLLAEPFLGASWRHLEMRGTTGPIRYSIVRDITFLILFRLNFRMLWYVWVQLISCWFVELGACFDSESSNFEDENWLLIFRNVGGRIKRWFRAGLDDFSIIRVINLLFSFFSNFFTVQIYDRNLNIHVLQLKWQFNR